MVTAAAAAAALAAAALAVDEFADNAYDAGVALVAVAFDDEKHEIMEYFVFDYDEEHYMD